MNIFSSLVWVLAAFIVFMIVLIVIGILNPNIIVTYLLGIFQRGV